MATDTTSEKMSDESQHDCPLMELPTELRLRIYRFAFKAIVDDIASDAASKRPVDLDPESACPLPSSGDQPIFFGALGFLHVSRDLRRESLDLLPGLAKA
jgi:hypothetical protein